MPEPCEPGVRSSPDGPGSPIQFIDFLSSPSTSGMRRIQQIMTNVAPRRPTML